MRTAIFAGSFDPFTIGHADVVSRGLRLFDRIVVAIGLNDSKQAMFSPEERATALTRLYVDNPSVEVRLFQGLTSHFAQELGAVALLRGIRTMADYEYERTMADTNRHLTGIETVLLFTDQRFSHISSSTVRELLRFGQSVEAFLPPGYTI